MSNSIRNEKNALEWSVFIISAVLILAILGYLVHHAVTSNGSPPQLEVTGVKDVSDKNNRRYYITVENKGEETAAEVIVALRVLRGGVPAAQGTMVFDFVPESSKRSGWYQFPEEMLNGDSLLFHVESYREP